MRYHNQSHDLRARDTTSPGDYCNRPVNRAERAKRLAAHTLRIQADLRAEPSPTHNNTKKKSRPSGRPKS